MDPSSSAALLRGREVEVDLEAYDDGVDAGSSSSDEDFSSGSGGEDSEGSDLESMTGRGIKCLCSELLELKKSSDEDFQKNVYSNYSTFIRIFKEVQDVESELVELKKHASDQKRLVKCLMKNLCMDNFSEHLLELTVENDLEIGNHLFSKPQTHSISILEELDILSLDQQFEEVLDILETENKNLQKIDGQGDLVAAEYFAPHRSALSEWRIWLADQLASMAGHPRVTAPELQKALSLLCRLGESCQANALLIQFYHSQLVNRMHDLQCSKSLLSRVYMTELTKTTFSVISQASRGFVMLHGETSSYSSEFIGWVEEEIKMFAHYFDMYIKSIYETNEIWRLAVESLKCAFYFCSLLKPQSLVLRAYLIKSLCPCMQDVLQLYVDYLRETIHIFTAADTWLLGKFLIPGITTEASSPVDDTGKLEYFWLTSSGRNFITLIQSILEDISPLHSLQMESSIIKGLADLFNEYVKILECCIPSFGSSVEKGSPRISSARKLPQQLSLLVNTWTLEKYLCSIAKCIFEEFNTSENEQVLDSYEASRHKELDSWIFSIQNATDQLRLFFCQQFVDRYISVAAKSTKTGSESYMKSLDVAGSSQIRMPSSEFQTFFQQLRQLESCGKSFLGGVDENIEKLLKELIDSVVALIKNNTENRRYSKHSSTIQQFIWSQQFTLDMHFLVEIATFGGCLSDRVMEASRSLVAYMENTFLSAHSDTSAVIDNAWASSAAKATIQKLADMEATTLEPDAKHMNVSEEDLHYESEQGSSEHDVTMSVELSDSEIETFAETDSTKPQKIGESGANPLNGIAMDFKAGVSDDKDSTSPSTAYIDMQGIPSIHTTKT